MQFNAKFIQHQQILRPTPDFEQFIEDLSPSQQKFIICTHGLSEESNLNNIRVAESIKKLLLEDIKIWRQNQIPSYCYYSIDASTAYKLFLEHIEYIHDGFNSRGIGDKLQRFLCSQIESLTDIYYASIPTINYLSLFEQSHFKQEFLQLQEYRTALIDTIAFFTSLANVGHQSDYSSSLLQNPANEITQQVQKASKESIQHEKTIITNPASNFNEPDTTAKSIDDMIEQIADDFSKITIESIYYNNNDFIDLNLPVIKANSTSIPNYIAMGTFEISEDKKDKEIPTSSINIGNSIEKFTSSKLLNAFMSLAQREVHHFGLNVQQNIKSGSYDNIFDVVEVNSSYLEHIGNDHQKLVSHNSNLIKIIQSGNSSSNKTYEQIKVPASLKDERDKRLKFPKPKIFNTNFHFYIIITTTNWHFITFEM